MRIEDMEEHVRIWVRLPPLLILLLAMASVSFATLPSLATGGSISNFTNATGLFYVHTFSSNGTFTTTGAGAVEVLVVAGGGAGGDFATYSGSGGGGAGGLLYNSSFAISASAFPVVVGLGGNSVAGTNGTNSSFSTMNAKGGGTGANRINSLDYGVGNNGGSGGGGVGASGSQVGGNGTAGQGNMGGAGGSNVGGGGGGAGGAGVNGDTSGNGGAGLAYILTGTLANYSCGGGGATYSGGTAGIGGCSFGGIGAVGSSAYGTNGTNGTGSGGGGAGGAGLGGNGGRGVVIITYMLNASSTPDTINLTLNSPATGYNSTNKTISYSYQINTNSSANSTLYLDGVAIDSQLIASTQNVSIVADATYGNHSWYVYAFKPTNTSVNASTANRTFEIYFNISQSGPTDNANLSGNTATLSFASNNLYNISCNYTIDGATANSSTIQTADTHYSTFSLASGTHTWAMACAASDNPSYGKSTGTRTFYLNYNTYPNVLTLSNQSQNVLASPQGLFYDMNGNLNVLYWTDNGTQQVVIQTIQNGAVSATYNATLSASRPYLAAMREIGKTQILTFIDSTTLAFIDFNGGISILTNTTTYNVSQNAQYDPYTFANSKQYSTLTLTPNSFYVLSAPITNSTANTTYYFQKNVSAYNLSKFDEPAHARKAASQSLAANAQLSSWYYAIPTAYNSTHDLWQINTWDGTTKANISTPSTTPLNQTEIEKSIIVFEDYGSIRYFGLFNTTNFATIYDITDNKSANLSSTISTPSHFYFVDSYTFVFFSTEGATTYAYSCYFNQTTPSCSRFDSTEYGAVVPYNRGPMTTAKRDDTNDVVAKGLILSNTTTQLLYDLNTYDVKFKCLNEMSEYRKLFTAHIFTDNSSNTLQNNSWGYVLPSALFGTGAKRAYTQCVDGSNRLYIIGLNSNFSQDLYSLNLSLGAYYTFQIINQYGLPIPNATISTYRFSSSKNGFVVVEQALTDFSGYGVLFLEPYTLYSMAVISGGYLSANFDYTPTGITSLQIRLNSNGSSAIPLPTFENIWSDVSYQLLPTSTFNTTPFNISFAVYSNASLLQYWGMSIIKDYNGTQTNVFSSNLTSAAGGSMLYLVNETGKYQVQFFFKEQNQSVFAPIPTLYYYGNSTSLLQATNRLGSGQAISGWGYYFVLLVLAMIGGGFAARYSFEGAGVIVLIILWGGSLLNPMAQVVMVVNGFWLTPIHITIVATLAVLGIMLGKNMW